jgi:hypothetical protein
MEKRPSAPPRMMTTMPRKSRRPPRVTTKEGIFSRDTRVPWSAPTTPQKNSAARMAAHHGHAGLGTCTSLQVTTPPKRAT